MDCMDSITARRHRYQTPNTAVNLAIFLDKINRGAPDQVQRASCADAVLYQRNAGAAGHRDHLVPALSNDPRIRPNDWRRAANLHEQFLPRDEGQLEDLSGPYWPQRLAGLFSLHDGLHQTADGKRSIKANDCNACHTILAQGSGAELDQHHAQGRNSNTRATKSKEAAMIATLADCKSRLHTSKPMRIALILLAWPARLAARPGRRE